MAVPRLEAEILKQHTLQEERVVSRFVRSAAAFAVDEEGWWERASVEDLSRRPSFSLEIEELESTLAATGAASLAACSGVDDETGRVAVGDADCAPRNDDRIRGEEFISATLRSGSGPVAAVTPTSRSFADHRQRRRRASSSSHGGRASLAEEQVQQHIVGNVVGKIPPFSGSGEALSRSGLSAVRSEPNLATVEKGDRFPSRPSSGGRVLPPLRVISRPGSRSGSLVGSRPGSKRGNRTPGGASTRRGNRTSTSNRSPSPRSFGDGLAAGLKGKEKTILSRNKSDIGVGPEVRSGLGDAFVYRSFAEEVQKSLFDVAAQRALGQENDDLDVASGVDIVDGESDDLDAKEEEHLALGFEVRLQEHSLEDFDELKQMKLRKHVAENLECDRVDISRLRSGSVIVDMLTVGFVHEAQLEKAVEIVSSGSVVSPTLWGSNSLSGPPKQMKVIHRPSSWLLNRQAAEVKRQQEAKAVEQDRERREGEARANDEPVAVQEQTANAEKSEANSKAGTKLIDEPTAGEQARVDDVERRAQPFNTGEDTERAEVRASEENRAKAAEANVSAETTFVEARINAAAAQVDLTFLTSIDQDEDDASQKMMDLEKTKQATVIQEVADAIQEVQAEARTHADEKQACREATTSATGSGADEERALLMAEMKEHLSRDGTPVLRYKQTDTAGGAKCKSGGHEGRGRESKYDGTLNLPNATQTQSTNADGPFGLSITTSTWALENSSEKENRAREASPRSSRSHDQNSSESSSAQRSEPAAGLVTNATSAPNEGLQSPPLPSTRKVPPIIRVVNSSDDTSKETRLDMERTMLAPLLEEASSLEETPQADLPASKLSDARFDVIKPQVGIGDLGDASASAEIDAVEAQPSDVLDTTAGGKSEITMPSPCFAADLLSASLEPGIEMRGVDVETPQEDVSAPFASIAHTKAVGSAPVAKSKSVATVLIGVQASTSDSDADKIPAPEVKVLEFEEDEVVDNCLLEAHSAEVVSVKVPTFVASAAPRHAPPLPTVQEETTEDGLTPGADLSNQRHAITSAGVSEEVVNDQFVNMSNAFVREMLQFRRDSSSDLSVDMSGMSSCSVEEVAKAVEPEISEVPKPTADMAKLEQPVTSQSDVQKALSTAAVANAVREDRGPAVPQLSPFHVLISDSVLTQSLKEVDAASEVSVGSSSLLAATVPLVIATSRPQTADESLGAPGMIRKTGGGDFRSTLRQKLLEANADGRLVAASAAHRARTDALTISEAPASAVDPIDSRADMLRAIIKNLGAESAEIAQEISDFRAANASLKAELRRLEAVCGPTSTAAQTSKWTEPQFQACPRPP
eukprot:TRINITY_DN5020_c1_g1_i1.p1 TRINITY_DN5020_c1_g1~~TRINITY_DN5020_c1_g1_i1.p1  ORF type:complete len:1324 (-),score=261.40 TRINITY_DN5020_c1_g1_i1:87-4058(-)